MLTVEMTSMPASSSSSTSCQRFSCARRRARWCGPARRRARPPGWRARIGVDVHLLERRAAVVDRACGGRPRGRASWAVGLRAGRGSRRSRRPRRCPARGGASPRRAWRRSCRRPARRRGRPAACPRRRPSTSPTGRRRRGPGSARARSPRARRGSPSCRPRGVRSDQGQHVGDASCRAPRPPGPPAARRWPPRCRDRGPTPTPSRRRRAPRASAGRPFSCR